METKKQYFKERNRSLCKRCYDILVFLRCKRSADILCKRCYDIYQLVTYFLELPGAYLAVISYIPPLPNQTNIGKD